MLAGAVAWFTLNFAFSWIETPLWGEVVLFLAGFVPAAVLQVVVSGFVTAEVHAVPVLRGGCHLVELRIAARFDERAGVGRRIVLFDPR